MPFFMNPFGNEFRGNWPLVDNHAFSKTIITLVVPPNRNTSTFMGAYNPAPYDFSALNTLTINYAIDANLVFFGSIPINVVGAAPAATTAQEVVTALNTNTQFSNVFTASAVNYNEAAVTTTDPLKT